MSELRAEGVDGFLGSLAPARFVSELSESQQIERCHGACRGFRAVVILFHPQENAGVLARAAKIPAPLFIEKEAVLNFLKLDRESQPPDLEAGFVKIEQTLDDKRVVIRETFHRASTFPIISDQDFPRWIEELRAKESRRADRRLEICRIV